MKITIECEPKELIELLCECSQPNFDEIAAKFNHMLAEGSKNYAESTAFK